jgi:sec-independent protein translocase protein TatA
MPIPGGWELVILIGILVLLFGAKRLPDMARSIGQSARVFKGEMKGMKNDEAAQPDKPADPPAAPAPKALPEAQPQAQEKATDSARASQPGSGSNSAQ